MSPEILVGLLAFVGTAIVGLLAWSLKRNIDSFEASMHEVKIELKELRQRQDAIEKEIVTKLDRLIRRRSKP